LVADGDQVWARFYLNGIHQSPLYGLPATGKRVGVPAVEIARFANGKIKESWCFGDELGLLLQLGVPDLLHG
jgi:predicted ester cyclase